MFANIIHKNINVHWATHKQRTFAITSGEQKKKKLHHRSNLCATLFVVTHRRGFFLSHSHAHPRTVIIIKNQVLYTLATNDYITDTTLANKFILPFNRKAMTTSYTLDGAILLVHLFWIHSVSLNAYT